jgi:acetoin utilization protein AcuB
MGDVMTPFPYIVDAGESVEIARQIMQTKEIRHLPVVSEGQLVGMITDRDIKLAEVIARGRVKLPELKVEDVCVFDVYVVEHRERLDTVVLRMAERRLGSALVLKDGRLVGIFTVNDACRRLGELLQISFPDC